MDKGIRAGVNFKFNEMLPQLKTLGGKAFRRAVLDWTVEQYGCTMAAASTHYNHAFHAVRKATPELVEGLGRPEGKNNGGRKKKEAAAKVVTPNALLDNMLKAVVKPAAAAEAAAEVEQTVFKVCKKSDGSVVAEGLTFEDAKALVEKAKAAKKATLYFV